MTIREHLLHAAEQLPAIRLLVLFGSGARNRTRADSDVDVGVWLDTESPAVRREVELALGRAVGGRLDLIDLATAPPQLRFEIARDGRLLVERAPHLWADFRARAMIDWWDWGPTARRIHEAAARRLRHRVGDGSP